MLHLLFLLLFLLLSPTMAGEESTCVQLLVEYHQCINKEQDVFNLFILGGQDGRGDWLEPKFCNFLTGVEQNCGKMLDPCYDEKESQIWHDLNMEVILDQAMSLFIGWDSLKCPVMREHLQRQELAIL